MPRGGGKYDDLARYVQEQTGAQGAVVIVIEGSRGTGFSCHALSEVAAALPQILRNCADEIEGSLTPVTGEEN